jgi:hypothetical protein
MWHIISPEKPAPTERDLALGVVDRDGMHALSFPCRRSGEVWVDEAGRLVDVHPTHWREWPPAGAE